MTASATSSGGYEDNNTAAPEIYSQGGRRNNEICHVFGGCDYGFAAPVLGFFESNASGGEARATVRGTVAPIPQSLR